MSKSGMILVMVCIILAIWDMIAELTGGVRFTESWFIRQTAERHPFFVFAIGCLIGHFFCGMKPE